MAAITIYRFSKYEIDTDEQIESDSYATLETIKSIGANPIHELYLVVDAQELDGNGFYRMSPTGEA
jgi:hypothetical protein